jgi:hypothetical protein
MASPLFAELARCATARAHLAGAESMAAKDKAHEAFADTCEPDAGPAERHTLISRCSVWEGARRRYWRELAAAATLTGHPWPAAEQLGGQP